MPNVRELDVFTRAVGGDFNSRVEFFRTFIWGSARVRRLGVVYRDIDDFLQDCFINVMRTSHTFKQKGGNLGHWVESVAAWTALEHQRQRDVTAPNGAGRIRLRAGIENDEPDDRLASYVPPRSGPGDTLAARIASLVGGPQFSALTRRAIDNASWEDTAAAVSKPLHAIGPFLVRTVDRLVRFFGAPPPLNDDLEPVFAWVVREHAKSRHVNPSKVKGRMVPMQLDPPFYALTPEMRKIGLSVPAEVRTLVLWDAARSSTAPDKSLRDHLDECHYCAELLRALILMQEALASSPGAGFLLCPGAGTLLQPQADSDSPETTDSPLEQHVEQCQSCLEERTRAFAGGAGVVQSTASGRGKMVAWAAAALLVLGAGGGYLVYRNASQSADKTTASLSTSLVPAVNVPPVKADPRFKGLAQSINLDDTQWMASVLPEDRDTFYEAVNYFHQGRVPFAMMTAGALADKDPGIQMLCALGLYHEQSPSEGYQAMLRSEAMPPRNPFRCWAAMQCALIVGDMAVATREAGHLANDPQYGARAKALLARARQLSSTKAGPAPATK